MPSSPSEVVVVGAGIIGSFTAYRLAREGVPVTLIERDDPGGMASFLRTLIAEKALNGKLAGVDPNVAASNFFATHPRTIDRVNRAMHCAFFDPAGQRVIPPFLRSCQSLE